MAVQPIGMKELPHTQPGAGAVNWGVTIDNAPSWITKTRDALGKGITTGGNKGNWEKLERWAQTPQANGVSPAQKALWGQFLKTGTMPQGLDPQIPYNAIDWTLRDTSREYKQKTSFLQDVLSSPFTAIAIGALTGGVGAFGSAALASAGSAAVGGSILGATATGALTGAATSAAISAGTGYVFDKLKPDAGPAPPSILANADIPGQSSDVFGGVPGRRPTGAGIGGGGGTAGGVLGAGTAQRGVKEMGFGGATPVRKPIKTRGAQAPAQTLLGS